MKRRSSFLACARILTGIVFSALAVSVEAQEASARLERYQQRLDSLEAETQLVRLAMEDLRMEDLRRQMKAVGFPSEDAIEHSAMFLAYSEDHEQAAWVMHMLVPEVISGKVGRTNDFRPDPKVSTGTAVEEDYFLKTLEADGTYSYDGFGFDRGHLAPSADFRWSEKALSESYYYSNMSPQRAEFNRGVWAELEDAMRAYLYRNPNQSLFIVTLPVLHETLPKIDRSINGVSIPEHYIKVALDLEKGRGIAFYMPNQSIESTLSSYAISIDEAERLSGFDFFPRLEAAVIDPIEAAFSIEDWLSAEALVDVEPLYPPDLPKGHFNTTQAKQHVGKGRTVIICGKVVGTRTSRSGNVWINLDKAYPNQVFSVYIRKEHLVNFPYDPEEALKDQTLCFEGLVTNTGGSPTMRIERDEQVWELEAP